MPKPSYGIDAPGVIRNLFLFGLAGFAIPLIFPHVQIGIFYFPPSFFLSFGVPCTIMGFWMLFYSMYGKMLHRNRMINLITWKGNEQVLDVGTGRGLMLIGAAKKLNTGFAVGIDVWNAEDLTHNSKDNTMRNAVLEEVSDRVEVKNESAVHMSFPDESFDVVFSNLCLHNIYNASDRKKACDEIARVMKKNGVSMISDFKHMREYRKNFEAAGLQTEMLSGSYLTTFPPLSILRVLKK